ncbi:BTAD domain-containing putative transcriptional regulator [Nonomuraea monospora]|uniref:BTAD domain-containing putative transcriptional regulator n=1 Tax=Nonomuraea monospora TaxID=568818 RepID=A0ABN3D299_9ACTN
MHFGILGQPAIWRHDNEIRLTTRRSRAVLAHLLLSPGHSASAENLMHAIYGDNPAKSARNQVHRGVGELRRCGVTIDVQDNVYRLDATPETIDAFVFMRMYDQAGRQTSEGEHAKAAETLGAALELWRGPALSGLDSEAFLTEAALWNERRLAAVEARVDALLVLGRHRELIAELQHLTDQHPLKERFHAQLMIALYRSHRASEALQVFTDLKERLLGELGTDPSPALSDLRLRILRQDVVLDSEDLDADVPRQLPARPGVLPGREGEVRGLVEALTEQPASPLVVITGAPGVGKTALALEAAHRVSGGFPDGQLYADDLGDPAQVLAGFLVALGVAAEEVPDGAGARAALLRSVLAVRRVLIVLDGVTEAGQVLPFLPGRSGSAVLVTSGFPLALPRDTVTVDVAALDDRAARALLATGAGPRRMRAEPAAADQIVRLCAGLPAALNILAAKLAARPQLSLQRLADRLAEPSRIMGELRHGGEGIMSTLMRGYHELPPKPRSLVRRIGYHGISEITTTTAAALADVSLDTAEVMLEELSETHFVKPLASGFRYRCHELILGFGHARARAEDDQRELDAAVERAFGAWLALTDAAHESMRGKDGSIPRGTTPRFRPTGAPAWTGQGSAWFEAHIDAHVALVRRAVSRPETCWELAVAPLALFEGGARFDTWLESHQIALAAVAKGANVRGQAVLTYSLGYRALLVGDHIGAARQLREALTLFQRLGDEQGSGLTLNLIGDLDRMHRTPATARETYQEAAAALHRSGDAIAEAESLVGLATVLQSTGDEAGSQSCLERALSLCREAGSLRSEARIRRAVAMHATKAGTPEKACPELIEALEIAIHIGDRVVQSDILLDLGTTRILLGDPLAAFDDLATAEEIARAAGMERTARRAKLARAFINGGGLGLHPAPRT